MKINSLKNEFQKIEHITTLPVPVLAFEINSEQPAQIDF